MSLKRWNGTSWVTVAGSRPGPQGATGPAGETAVQNVITELDSWKADQILNLGVYYPKYEFLTNMTQQNATLLATSMIF